MATESSVAQYLPSRYSRTKAGTVAPTLTARTRSLRTTFPASARATFRSRSSSTASVMEPRPSEGRHCHREAGDDCQDTIGKRVEENHVYLLPLGSVLYHERDRVRSEPSSVISERELHGTGRLLEAIGGGHCSRQARLRLADLHAGA